MAAKSVQITIESLSINERGPKKDKEDLTVLEFTLRYPRANVDEVKTIKALPASEPVPQDYASVDLQTRMVFKQEIEGECELEVKALAIDNPTEFEKFVIGVFKTAFLTQLGTITSGISNLIVNKVTSSIADQAGGKIEAQKNTQLLGKCVFSIDGSAITSGPLDSDLRLGENDSIVEEINNPNPEVWEKEKKELLGPNSVNGHIRLTVKVL